MFFSGIRYGRMSKTDCLHSSQFSICQNTSIGTLRIVNLTKSRRTEKNFSISFDKPKLHQSAKIIRIQFRISTIILYRNISTSKYEQ